MPTLTTKQLADVEINGLYKNRLRQAGLAKASFEKGLAIAATEAWYRTRNVAEELLSAPEVSINKEYWASQSMGMLKNISVNGIDADSPAELIATNLTDANYETLAGWVWPFLTGKVKFTPA